MKILIFTEGTILMHKAAAGHAREEIIRQVKDQDQSVHDYASYLPIGRAQAKISEWSKSGQEIAYLTSRRKLDEVQAIQKVLDQYAFPKGGLFYRKSDEAYHEVAERIMPDILVEDDCESIGGKKETAYYAIAPEKKKRIKQILVKEFLGIDEIEI